MPAILGWIGVFFGGGTVAALTLCGGAEDAELRLRQAIEDDADEFEREANELVLQ